MTGLPALEVLRAELPCGVNGSRWTVGVLTIDRLDATRAALGGFAGDLLLALVARRVERAQGPGAYASLLPVAQIVVLLPHDVDRAMRRLLAVYEHVAEPVSYHGRLVFVTWPNLGFAEAGAGDSFETVIRQAQLAMRRAERDGLGIAAYDEGLDRPRHRQGLRPRPEVESAVAA